MYGARPLTTLQLLTMFSIFFGAGFIGFFICNISYPPAFKNPSVIDFAGAPACAFTLWTFLDWLAPPKSVEGRMFESYILNVPYVVLLSFIISVLGGLTCCWVVSPAV